MVPEGHRTVDGKGNALLSQVIFLRQRNTNGMEIKNQHDLGGAKCFFLAFGSHRKTFCCWAEIHTVTFAFFLVP